MRYWNIVKIFWVDGRMCTIIKYNSFPNKYPKGYHNGYVESNYPERDYYDYDTSEEPTYKGEDPVIEGKTFIGFDTIHSHDTEESQSFEVVVERTKKFAREIVEIEREWDKLILLN